MNVNAALPVAEAMIIKIAPLYGVMFLGFIFGRARPKVAEALSYLQIYFIAPVVFLGSTMDMEFRKSYLLLPIITFLIGCMMRTLLLPVGKMMWKDNTPNLLSYACSSANSGYFGIPVALVVLPPEFFGIFMMAGMGTTLFDNSLGYYTIARGHFTVRDSLVKLSRLPALYAFAAGVIMSAIGQHVPAFANDIVRDFRGCYVVLGAMMIGLGLSRLEHLKTETKLAAFVFISKFLLWPLLALCLIGLDKSFLHLFPAEVYKILLLISICPLPANAIAFALQLNVQPDKASTLVFLSTVFALFYIPLCMAIWG